MTTAVTPAAKPAPTEAEITAARALIAQVDAAAAPVVPATPAATVTPAVAAAPATPAASSTDVRARTVIDAKDAGFVTLMTAARTLGTTEIVEAARVTGATLDEMRDLSLHARRSRSQPEILTTVTAGAVETANDVAQRSAALVEFDPAAIAARVKASRKAA